MENNNRYNDSNQPRQNNSRRNDSNPNQPRRESFQQQNTKSNNEQRPLQNQNKSSNSILTNLDNRKKLLIGLGLIGLIAAAAGIAEMISNAGKVRILQVQNATVTAQQPFQNCGEVSTTSYSNYHKNGTNGAIIGGVGGAVVGGLVTHSWVGAGVGALVGGVGGDLVQRSYQPNIVAHHGEKTVCHQDYRPVQVPIGYNVQFMDHDDNVGNLVTAHQPPIGEKVPLVDLQRDEVTQQQQQQIVQQYINGSSQNGQQQSQPQQNQNS